MITYCVRTSMGGKRGSVCVVIRPVCLALGQRQEVGGEIVEWHRVRGPSLTGADGRVRGGPEPCGLMEDGSGI